MPDITVEGHVRGPMIGAESFGFHSICDCGDRFDGNTPGEVRDAHEQHVAAIVLKPGVAKARQALATSIERGKPESVVVQG